MAMKNIGLEMKKKLLAVGVDSAEELMKIGSKEAFLRLKALYPEICLVHLYTLQGAIDGCNFNMLSSAMKAKLKSFNDALNS